MDLEYLKDIREEELTRMLALLPKSGKVLEIGAGAGWQARRLSELGFDITAVDVETGNYRQHQVWPVQLYDGKHLEFPDESFDIIFSSNVLEHVEEIEKFQLEMARVLRKDGVAIHIMPSVPWRTWTLLGHYFGLLKKFFSRVAPAASGGNTSIARGVKRSLVAKILNVIVPRRHGERGNVFSEFVLFGKEAWKKVFQENGWTVVRIEPSNLWYTGHCLVGGWLSIDQRTRISTWLGSSANIFVVKRSC